MKHLTTYKIFEKRNPFIWFGDLQSEINELLGNLIDDGHQVLVNKIYDSPMGIEITIGKIGPSLMVLSHEKFKWGEVRPEIERMMDYLDDRFIIKDTTLYTSISGYRKFNSITSKKLLSPFFADAKDNSIGQGKIDNTLLVSISIKLIFKDEVHKSI